MNGPQRWDKVGELRKLWGAKRGNWKSHKPSKNPCMMWTNLINISSYLLHLLQESYLFGSLDSWFTLFKIKHFLSILLFEVVYSGKNPLSLTFDVTFSFSSKSNYESSWENLSWGSYLMLLFVFGHGKAFFGVLT